MNQNDERRTTNDERVTTLACLLRSAHCTLDMLSGRLEMGEKERVLELCQTLRNAYTDAFENLERAK